MESLILPVVGKIYRKDINRKNFEKLKHEYNGSYMESVSQQSASLIFKLNNGGAVVERNGYYTHYENYTHLLEVLKYINVLSNPREILFGRNIYGSNFTSYTNTLIKDITLQLGITSYVLNKNLLNTIDKSILELNDSRRFHDDFFLHEVALIGEVLVVNNSCRWEMELSGDNETWNPIIYYNYSRINLIGYLHDDIFENKFDDALSNTYYSIIDIIKFNL